MADKFPTLASEKAELKKYFLEFWMQVMAHHKAASSQGQPDRRRLYTRS